MNGDGPAPSFLCACRAVERRRIEELIEAGMTRALDLRRATGAGEGCGSCREALFQILIEKRKTRDRNSLRASPAPPSP